MAVTIQRYNHTRQRFVSGANASSDTYKVMLCTSATFNATHTTLAAITRTEIAAANGYVAGGITLTGVTSAIVNTDGANWDADNMSVTASGGSISALFGILYNDTDADDPPLYFIDFDGTVTAPDGVPFVIEWDAAGIETFNNPA